MTQSCAGASGKKSTRHAHVPSGEEAPADAGDSAEWRRVVIGRTHAIGRLHRNEFSLATVEMVAEGSDVAESVQAEVFGPLRKLEACCG